MAYKRRKKFSVSQFILKIILSILALVSVLPVVLIFIVSFSSELSVEQKGFSFFPNEWSLAAYEYVGTFFDQVVQSYKITIFETVVATFITLLFTSMFAFAMSRRNFALRGFLSKFLLITMLFNGGMLSSYLVNVNYYNMRNNLLVLILPGSVSAFNCIVMRTFITSNVPDTIVDAAKIDGAGDVYMFFRIVVPIMVPVLAAIGFMTAVGHWNQWMTSYLYIDDTQLTSLQLMLIRIERNLEFLKESRRSLSPEEMEMLLHAPGKTARMAVLICSLGPILVIYPFFQKYFIKGITIGSVKG